MHLRFICKRASAHSSTKACTAEEPLPFEGGVNSLVAAVLAVVACVAPVQAVVACVAVVAAELAVVASEPVL